MGPEQRSEHRVSTGCQVGDGHQGCRLGGSKQFWEGRSQVPWFMEQSSRALGAHGSLCIHMTGGCPTWLTRSQAGFLASQPWDLGSCEKHRVVQGSPFPKGLGALHASRAPSLGRPHAPYTGCCVGPGRGYTTSPQRGWKSRCKQEVRGQRGSQTSLMEEGAFEPPNLCLGSSVL